MAKRVGCFLGLVGALAQGETANRDLEIVLAQYDEDLSWSDAHKGIRTIYCKGPAETCGEGAHPLKNVGREAHTFLHHIVHNYDKLAKWTVFSQAGAPSEGYLGKGQGGHLLTGVSFDDYLKPDSDAKFLMTSKVHLPTVAHSLRSSFRTGEGQVVPSAQSSMCPATDSDTWGPYTDVPALRAFLSEKCSVEPGVLGESMMFFWDSFVQLPRPHGSVAHYVQGSRFAASRERIQQRPKQFYQHLLAQVSQDPDPCFSYLYELAWFYLIGAPQEACAATPADESEVWLAAPRSLSTSNGTSGNGTPTTGTVRACGLGAASVAVLAAMLS